MHRFTNAINNLRILDQNNSGSVILDVRNEVQECIECYFAQQRKKTVSSGQKLVEEEEYLQTAVVERENEKTLEGGDIQHPNIQTVAEVMEQEESAELGHGEGERVSQTVVNESNMRNEESAYMDDSQSSALPVVGNVITVGRNVEVDQHSIDAEEEEKVVQFHSNGCGCSKKCSTQFTLEHIREMRANIAQLNHTALDMTIRLWC